MRKIGFLTLLFIITALLTGCTYNKTKTIDENKMQEVSIEKTPPYLRVHYIYAGQADATLLQMETEEEKFNILIDAGDWNNSYVSSYLKAEKIEDLDLVVITHPHSDHLGQLDKILDSFHVEEVWMNGDSSNTQVFLNALKAIEKEDIGYYEPRAGDVFDIGDLHIEVIHPADLSMGINNNSLVMRITYDDINFLFTGDAEREAEEKMLASGADLSAHILHLGHHGSKTSNSVEFLEAVQPEIAIYSAGIDNSYGLPNREVIERVNFHHTIVYGTDFYGTILLETDGKKYHVTTEKEGTLPPPTEGEACVNINTASSEELQEIIHIGEKTAQELIRLRPYGSLNELVNINGIGPSRLQDIKEQKAACLGG